jgi:hypothetical protein
MHGLSSKIPLSLKGECDDEKGQIPSSSRRSPLSDVSGLSYHHAFSFLI